jgi:uncharacterized protein (DUF2267 family)
MNPSSDADLLTRLHELGPFSDDGEALRALHVTLEIIGQGLTDDERRAVAASLPTECARVLLGARAGSCRNTTELFHGVRTREKTTLSRAVEHTEIVCRALGEVLSPTARTRLRRAVPDIAALFERPDETGGPLPLVPSLGTPNDLAEGRPGGSHPLSSANPAELSHRHSVARSDDPHAETKLSSACGLTQEREERSLATGRPGSRRPLSTRH